MTLDKNTIRQTWIDTDVVAHINQYITKCGYKMFKCNN